MSILPPPKSPTTSTILTLLILLLSLTILILTILLTTWATKPLQSYPTILVTSSPSTSSAPSRILAFLSKYNSYGLVLNIIPGAGGTIDALLLCICLFSINHIYIGRRTHLAKLSKAAARDGRAPTWLWAVTIFIIAFSVARSLVGFVGSMVGYYSSAKFTLPDRTDGDGAYVSGDGRGFSVGGWTCQVKDYVVSGDAYASKLRSLCMQEQAARWLTLPLLICYSLLLGVVVLRFVGEKGRVRREVKGERKVVGNISESE